MRSVNRVTLVGNLGTTPDLERLGENGIAHTELRIALNRPRRKDEEQVTDWVSVHAWRELAENCALYLRRGSAVYLEGRLRPSHWQNEAGERLSRLEIHASSVVFLDRPSDEGDGGGDEEA